MNGRSWIGFVMFSLIMLSELKADLIKKKHRKDGQENLEREANKLQFLRRQTEIDIRRMYVMRE